MSDFAAEKMLLIFRSGLDRGQIKTGLDAAILAATFDQEVALLLIGEATALLSDSETAKLQQLADFGVKHVYVETDALRSFPMELLSSHKFLVPVDKDKIKRLMHQTQHIVSF